ncbi:MAG: DUF4058 family protein [Isosphaeraceae bacterium]
MPFRDHFRPPVSTRSSWEGFHGGWPMVIVQKLRPHLPDGYIAEPRVRLGTFMEIDVGALETDAALEFRSSESMGNGGGSSTSWAGERPVVAIETDPPEEYEYEVRVFDLHRERRLVAAIELVSPANKDRAPSREAFVAKCASLLRGGVAVSIVDLVAIRRFNLYAQLMEFIGHPDPTMTPHDPPTYAASCRWPTRGTRARLEAWSHTLVVGKPMPTLPLWLDDELSIPLDLEASYEQTCHDLRID